MERNLEFGTVDLHFIREYVPLGKPLFEMCWFYNMGNRHCPNSFRPSTPLCQMGKRGKKGPQTKPSWQALTPAGNVGNKCPKPSWLAFTPPPPPLTGNANTETTHF